MLALPSLDTDLGFYPVRINTRPMVPTLCRRSPQTCCLTLATSTPTLLAFYGKFQRCWRNGTVRKSATRPLSVSAVTHWP